MRSRVFRVIGGLLAALAAWALVAGVRDGALAGNLYMLIVMPVGVVVLSVYALAGERAANRLLAPLLWLGELPERAWAWVIRRLDVKMPGHEESRPDPRGQLRDPDAAVPELSRGVEAPASGAPRERVEADPPGQR